MKKVRYKILSFAREKLLTEKYWRDIQYNIKGG